ncbi:MAG: hypothetical protein Rubg2KO_34400 [Rubricoccaceae bacterium]
MHLAFVSQFDPADVRAYSGIPYYMVRALRKRVDRLSLVPPLQTGGSVQGRIAKLRHRVRGERYLRHHTWAGVRPMVAEASRQIEALKPDAVLSPSTLPLAGLRASCPTACWPDATFEANLDFYPGYSGLADELVNEAHDVEKTALETATLSLFATEHAARSATGYYGIDDSKVHVVPYGTNLDPVPTEIELAIRARESSPVRLLFVGGDWVRKGGDVALRVAEEMTALGTPTTLTVAGPRPPVASHPLLKAIGFLHKSIPAEEEHLRRLFRESHFLCMPVRAEDFGCVFAEAAAFGLPSLTTAIGGMPTTVGDGDAGLLFPFQEQPQVIAKRALDLLASSAYSALCHSARAKFERVLNWDTAVDRAVSLLERAA